MAEASVLDAPPPIEFRREARFVREPFDGIHPRQSHDLIKGLWPSEGVGFVAGPSGSYKTFVALLFALCVARGVPVLGRRTRRSGVIYVAAEAPNGVRRRVQAWKQEHSSEQGLPFSLIGQAPDLRDDGCVEDLIAELRLAADEFKVSGLLLGLVVIDTLATAMPGGDENASVDMGRVLGNLGRIATGLGVFVAVVSHTGKDEGRGLRGWSGQHAGADAVVMLSRETTEAGEELRIGRVAKVKEGKDGQRFLATLRPILLGRDEDDDPITSAIVELSEAPDSGTKARVVRLNAPAETVLAILGRMIDAGQTKPVPLVPGVRAGTVGVHIDDLRAAAFDAGILRAEQPAPEAAKIERDRWLYARRKAFQRALDSLAMARKLRHEGEWVWLL